MESHSKAARPSRNCASVLRTDDPYAPHSRHTEQATSVAAAPFGAAGHHSARAAPSAHLPLSKVNREVRSAHGQKSRPKAASRREYGRVHEGVGAHSDCCWAMRFINNKD